MTNAKLKNNIISAVQQLYSIDAKHKEISVIIVVDFKFTSTSMKFIHNYALEVKPFHNCKKKILLFTKDVELYEKYANYVVDGYNTNLKKVKKSEYSWSLANVDVSKYKGTINRKSLLPNNLDNIVKGDLNNAIQKVIEGSYIKIFQMNNYISAKISDVSVLSQEDTIENILKLCTFISEKGLYIRKFYLHRSMCKSYKVQIK
ncbi:hypothetical protein AB837_00184 [bacterium AB1]|nr:hypothetical protein AB837_00184 [bacterium AB1]